jgi:hypothetical protein
MTMKLVLTLWAILPLMVFCQNPDATKPIKISLGISFSPDYCYRTLIPNASSKWIAEARDTFEIPTFGYTTGLNLALKISKRIILETGLLFSDRGEKTHKYSLFALDTLGQLNSEVPIKITYFFHYLYLEIPLKIKYCILNRRMKVFISGGISPNIFLTQKTRYIAEYLDGHTNTHTSTSSSDYRILNLSIIASAGMSYDVTSRLYFTIEPTYRRSIISIVDAPIKTFLYSIGLNTGLYYRI